MKDYNSINLELVKQIQIGNKNAWENLIKNNIGILSKRVKHYSGTIKYLTEEDLYQEAAIGLYKAALKFDLSMDNTFITYAMYYIDQMIITKIQDFDNMIRIPRYIQEEYIKYYRCDPSGKKTFKEKCVENNWDEKELRYFLTTHSIPISLDKIVEDSEDNNRTLYDVIKDDNSPEVEDIMITRNLKNIVKKYMNECLTEKEKYVVRSRFEDELTLEETGKTLGVTRERIRQIEVKAMRKLRQKLYYKTSLRGEIPTMVRE